MSLIKKFGEGLLRSREGFIRRLDFLFRVGEIDAAFYDELEEILIQGDVGVKTTSKLLQRLREEVGRTRARKREEARKILTGLLVSFMTLPLELEKPPGQPLVILLVGVNGSGKTTTAAKLARHYKEKGKKVLLVAGDTFRAAAIDQIQIWAERAGVELVRTQPGSDPGAVFFDALEAARARGSDVVIGDTAGRLHTKTNLMHELEKINRVISRSLPGAPHQVLLVIDATTGQNGVVQAASFSRAVPVSGLVLTKLDGTARGGIVVGIQETLALPVCYVGTGEKMDDLAPFDAAAFAGALLGRLSPAGEQE